MPLDGNGGYNPPSPENPVRAGTLIKSDDFNTTIDDVSDALSTAIYRDGQAAMEADLNIGHNNLVQVASVQNDERLRITTGTTLQIEAEEGASLEGGLTLDELTLQDGRTVSKHTTVGGQDHKGESVLTDPVTGLLDASFIAFQPSPDSCMQLLAEEELTAGDFVVMGASGGVMRANSSIAYIPCGFVLDAAGAGELVWVYFSGYNNKVDIIGDPLPGRQVYLTDYETYGNSHTCSYTPIYQKAGVVVAAGVVRFIPSNSLASNAKIIYLGS